MTEREVKGSDEKPEGEEAIDIDFVPLAKWKKEIRKNTRKRRE